MTYGLQNSLDLSCILLQILLLPRITQLNSFCYLFCYDYLMVALILGRLCVDGYLNLWCKVIVHLPGKLRGPESTIFFQFTHALQISEQNPFIN